MRLKQIAGVVATTVTMAVGVAAGGDTDGMKILDDRSLFSEAYAAQARKVFEIAADVPRVSIGLPGPAPRVDEIRRAYGDPSEVRDDTLAGGVPVRVHFYGSLGFAVAPDDREGRVIGLVRLLRAGAEPGRGRAASTPQKPRAVPKDRPSFWVSTGKRSISWTRPPSDPSSAVRPVFGRGDVRETQETVGFWSIRVSKCSGNTGRFWLDW